MTAPHDGSVRHSFLYHRSGVRSGSARNTCVVRQFQILRRWPEAPFEQAYRILVVGLAVGQASCCTPVRCVEFEGHTIHGHNRDFPACEPVQRIQQVLCGPPPSGKFADQDRVNLPGLCKIEQSVARGAINAGPGGRLFEDADDAPCDRLLWADP